MFLAWLIFDILLVVAFVLLFWWRAQIRASNREQVVSGRRDPLTKQQIMRRRRIGYSVLAIVLVAIAVNLFLTHST